MRDNVRPCVVAIKVVLDCCQSSSLQSPAVVQFPAGWPRSHGAQSAGTMLECLSAQHRDREARTREFAGSHTADAVGRAGDDGDASAHALIRAPVGSNGAHDKRVALRRSPMISISNPDSAAANSAGI